MAMMRRGCRRGWSLRGTAAALAVVLLSACASTLPPLSQQDDATGIEMLRQRFAEEQFLAVIAGAGEFLSAHPGSRYRDEAMYLLARARYEEGEFLESEEGFRSLLREFPDSDQAEISAYYLGLALLSQARSPQLDQEERKAAQVQFRSFLNRYPDSRFAERARGHIASIREALAEKEFRNAVTYRQVRALDAALFYFEDKVLKAYPETSWAPRAMLEIAGIQRKREQWEKVAEWAGRYLAEHPGGEDAGRAREYLEEARERIDASDAASRDADGSPEQPR